MAMVNINSLIWAKNFFLALVKYFIITTDVYTGEYNFIWVLLLDAGMLQSAACQPR